MGDIKMFTVSEYFRTVGEVLSQIPLEPVAEIVSLLQHARRESRMVFCCGNGGSAGNASHFVNDVLKSTVVEGRPRFRLICLSDNVPTLTAYANDVGYDVVFSEPLRSLGMPGDVLLAISGSGNSPNILRAVEAAKQMGIKTVGLAGFQGGRLAPLCDVAVTAPSDSMQIIEDVHLILLHSIFVQLCR